MIRKAQGEWLIGVQPSILLTELCQDNTTLFLPFSFWLPRVLIVRVLQMRTQAAR